MPPDGAFPYPFPDRHLAKKVARPVTGEMLPALVLSSDLAALGTVRSLAVAGVQVINVHYADSGYSHVSKYVRVSEG